MTSDRIKEIQETTAYPESRSVKQALLQVWNECEQDSTKYSEEDMEEMYNYGYNNYLPYEQAIEKFRVKEIKTEVK